MTLSEKHLFKKGRTNLNIDYRAVNIQQQRVFVNLLVIVYCLLLPFQLNAATIQQIHLAQLGTEVFEPYQDVIVAVQAGGIGAYGEWFYAPPTLTTAEARKEMLDSLFVAVPDSIKAGNDFTVSVTLNNHAHRRQPDDLWHRLDTVYL